MSGLPYHVCSHHVGCHVIHLHQGCFCKHSLILTIMKNCDQLQRVLPITVTVARNVEFWSLCTFRLSAVLSIRGCVLDSFLQCSPLPSLRSGFPSVSFFPTFSFHCTIGGNSSYLMKAVALNNSRLSQPSFFTEPTIHEASGLFWVFFLGYMIQAVN